MLGMLSRSATSQEAQLGNSEAAPHQQMPALDRLTVSRRRLPSERGLQGSSHRIGACKGHITKLLLECMRAASSISA